MHIQGCTKPVHQAQATYIHACTHTSTHMIHTYTQGSIDTAQDAQGEEDIHACTHTYIHTHDT